MNLRPYQREANDAVLSCFCDYPSTLMVMATGLGKTVAFATLAHEWETGRILILAHREELIAQAADKIRQITGEEPGIEMAEEKVDALDRCKVVVSSVQTLCRPKRLAKFQPDQFGLFICDEAHHATAASYLTVIDHFRQNASLKLLGATATPKRADGLAMGQVFDSVAYDYGIEPASHDGWLVPVRQRVVKVDGLDFSACRSTNRDLNEHDLEAIMREERMLHAVVAPTIELAADLPALVFAVTIRHAEQLCEVLNRYKQGSAHAISKDTPRDRRRELIRDYKAGRLQYLVSVGVFTEGFDAPNTALIVMARPTKSIVVYTQAIGRGTRTLPGVIDGLEEATADERCRAIAQSDKPHVLVLDFAGNAGRHKLIQATDLLGGKYSAAVRQYAKQTLEDEGKAAPIGDALERAQAELLLEEQRRERLRRLERVKARADYRTYNVSPYGGSEARGGAAVTTRSDGPSVKQINYLVYLGVARATAEAYSRRQASAVIDKLLEAKKRRDHG